MVGWFHFRFFFIVLILFANLPLNSLKLEGWGCNLHINLVQEGKFNVSVESFMKRNTK